MNRLNLVITFVGLCLLGSLIAITLLAYAQPARTIPDVLIAVASGSLTGLVGMLVNPKGAAQ